MLKRRLRGFSSGRQIHSPRRSTATGRRCRGSPGASPRPCGGRSRPPGTCWCTGDAEPLDRLARVQRAVDVHQQHVAIGDREAIGAGHAGRIQQAVDHDRVRIGRRLFQVIGDEIREFLRLAHAGVDCQAARGLAVLAFLADRAEVAGAEEGGEVAVGVLAGVQAETGEAEVGRQLAVLDAALAVVERRAVIGQLLRLAVDHVEHAHRRMEVQAQVEELGLELARLVGPQRMVLAVADRLVLVPVQPSRRPGSTRLWLL
jgi:hypothetical protein